LVISSGFVKLKFQLIFKLEIKKGGGGFHGPQELPIVKDVKTKKQK